LCEKPKTYRVYYGIESLKTYAPGNYDEYNEKSISEVVIFDEVSICGDCANKLRHVNMYRYAVKLWSAKAVHSKKLKCCYRCHHISESTFCNHYKCAIPWWVKYFIYIDKIEPVIDLGPVKHVIYCKEWKPQSLIYEESFGSLKSRFQMGLYLIKYHKKIRIKIKSLLFKDLFSIKKFVDDIKSLLNLSSSNSILGISYLYLLYKPYRNIVESNIYKKYYATRAKLKDWAEELS
jgi:hypothetical protein